MAYPLYPEPCNCGHLFNHVWVKINELEAKIKKLEGQDQKELDQIVTAMFTAPQTQDAPNKKTRTEDPWEKVGRLERAVKNNNGSAKRKRRRNRGRK